MIKQLTKFSGPTPYALQNLERGAIYCQHYSCYNDPFEFWAEIHEGIPDAMHEPKRFQAALRAWGMASSSPEDENLVAYFDECQDYQPPFRQMRDTARIACFGSQPDNLLMWSHYADGLRGFCIIYDEDLIVEAEPEGIIVDVAYLCAPPILDSFVYAIAKDQEWYNQVAIEETEARVQHAGKEDEASWIPIYQRAGIDAVRQMREIWQLVFATKPLEWEYERERRLLVQTNLTDTTPVLRPYPQHAIKEIIFGERMPKDYKTQIMSILKKHYGSIPIKVARRAQESYSLVVD